MSLTSEEITVELAKCHQSCVYFTRHYCRIRNEDGQWIPFNLWPEQAQALRVFLEHKKVAALKARQIGFTWLALARALHALLFQSGITVLLFSLREKEAQEILGRLADMYEHLPEWLRFRNFKRSRDSNKSVFQLPNESRAMAFPSGTGDSYTAKIAIVDEADLVGMDLGKLINSVQPTIEAGGQLYLISKSNKALPDSPFKKIYRSGRNEESDWKSIFLSWKSRPGRTQAWYENLKRSKFAETGSHDYIFENYPNTDAEALSPSELDKRIPGDWIANCLQPRQPFSELPPSLRFIQGLKMYCEVKPYRNYVLGVDTAEGLLTSDDSAIVVLDQDSGEEAASFAGKATPRRTGEFAKALSKYYNKGATLFERNNHGHAFHIWWQEYAGGFPLLNGLDDNPGWQENKKSKAVLYVHAADQFRDLLTRLHTQKTADQLQLIGADTLKAPEGEHDDLAIAYVLALMAAEISTYRVPLTSRREEMATPQPLGVFGTIGNHSTPFGVRPMR